ncbi:MULTISPECIES: complex I subunit 4 family protein [Aliarcobacter]|jgi:NADH-quinone oxidoreductase subunit M|uniref:NADH-quinone oxidoreductase subunit M n=1 Tax=Aliarcobacter skirrowii TaxID=28200 RepID=A0A2U2C1R2_9BACT|nr:NADH-quinone oxidoreductase subunit M [Aliarcobacter skirrowii]AZL54578.1 NADH-quinone oxidoreductase subunit M [Aliarcobacter skirrowii]MDD2508252.1 NADH-quinone oxidoreductase subunit M [Aliarcobacter skirrowii]MDD3025055.1 NADH-quinone oxidoreductase subunit M [Aliarcobacter skirrowii]MDD3496682.1 NADH-quinone oxidoreductase subunit M [Aliarcobacter skirrowii]MDX4011914.1 NADH-quinone oxidoreductase subunit M [Aliarcobacter skirrowii]
MSADILSFIIFLPAVVAIGLMITTKDVNTIRNIAFLTTTVILALVLKIYIEFEPSAGMQFVTNVSWIETYGINYYIGLDGFSLTILMMIAILIPTSYLLLWEGKTKGYWINMLLVQTGVTGALLSLDLILFYFFWEIMLLPVFLMIGQYGFGDKVFTTIKVTVYTMAGSLLMLVGILYLGVAYFNEFGVWSFAYDNLMMVTELDRSTRVWLFLAFLAAFAIKVPLFPLHTWIMETYKNAPTGAVFLLSSIMAKLGVYAIVRFLIPIFPDVYVEYATWFVILGLFGLVYFGVAALMQDDIKRMFAYSSASHLSFIAAGIFSLNSYGINGALYLVIAHAIATGALFLLVGLMQEQTGFKTIKDLGGIAKKAPIFTFIFAIMLFANVGLPGTNGFVSELLIIFGVFNFNPYLGAVAALSVIIGASYMLWMFQRAILQDRPEGSAELKMRDLKIKEIVGLIPWVILVFIMGVYPEIFIDKFEPTVTHYLQDILQIGATK